MAVSGAPRDGTDWGCVIPVAIAMAAGGYFLGKNEAQAPPPVITPILDESAKPAPAASKLPEDPKIGPLVPAAEAPVVPTHNYEFAEGRTYGYFSAVSEEDREKGKAVGEVFLYRYNGFMDGKHRLTAVNEAGQMLSWSECSDPCKAIRHYANGRVEMIPYSPRSIIGAAFEDAVEGRLKKWQPPTPPKSIPHSDDAPALSDDIVVTLEEEPASSAEPAN